MSKNKSVKRIENAIGTFVYYKFIRDFVRHKLEKAAPYGGSQYYDLVVYNDEQTLPQCSLTYELDRMVREDMQGSFIFSDEEFLTHIENEVKRIEDCRAGVVQAAIDRANVAIDEQKKEYRERAMQEYNKGKKP